MATQIQEKTFKLPPEVRNYHKQKEREKRGDWKCSQCGVTPKDNEPLYKNTETKQKLCSNCVAREIIERKEKKEQINAMPKVS
jgi:hypothetical protein